MIETSINEIIAALLVRDNSSESARSDLTKIGHFPVVDSWNVVQVAEVYEYALSIIEQRVKDGFNFNIFGDICWQNNCECRNHNFCGHRWILLLRIFVSSAA